MNTEYYKELKPINGCYIDKCADINNRTGKIKLETVVYVVTHENDDGSFWCDCFKTLKEAKKCAMEWSH
jgi:hypothetical protein